MNSKPFRPRHRAAPIRPTRKWAIRTLWLAPLLLLAGALLDPALIAPIGPLAAPAERVSFSFEACGPGAGAACVIDGDTFRIGDRRIRITGINAPEVAEPGCPREAELGKRASKRLLALLNEGEFDMIAHRLKTMDRHGRELMVLKRGGSSLGARLIDEGLAHRYIGSKRSWCG